MKKVILSILAASTFATVTYVPQSQAVIAGLISSPAALTVSAVVILGSGGVGISSILFDMLFTRRQAGLSDTVLPASAVVAGLGFILLDNQTQSLVYQSINENQAHSLGMSVEEMRAYNNELDLINIMADEMNHQIAELQQSELNTKEEKLKFVSDLKDRYDLLSANLGVSPEAGRALVKVSSHSLKAK